MAGYTFSFGSSNGFIIRTDQNGNLGVCAVTGNTSAGVVVTNISPADSIADSSDTAATVAETPVVPLNISVERKQYV